MRTTNAKTNLENSGLRYSPFSSGELPAVKKVSPSGELLPGAALLGAMAELLAKGKAFQLMHAQFRV